MTDASPARPSWIAAAVLLSAFFIFTRFYRLTDRPMHNDEGVNGHFSMNLIRSNSYKYDPNNYHGPSLYYLQLPFSWAVTFTRDPGLFRFSDDTGLNVATARSLVAVASLLALAGILATAPIIGPWGALCAFLLAGTSCTFLFYSRYYIHETLVVLFTFGIYFGAWFFEARRKAAYLIGTVVSAALLFCTKETGIFHIAILALAWMGSAILQDLINGINFTDGVKRLMVEARATMRMASMRDYLLAGVVAVLLWALFFSSFFKNPQGLKDSFIAYLPWTRQGMESGHVKAWSYFLAKILFPYEIPLLVLGLIGTAAAFVTNNRQGLFLFLWSFGMIAAYSLIPYKTPWCAANFIFPLALLSGFGIQTACGWLAAWPRPELQKRVSIIGALAVFLLVVFRWPLTWRVNYIEYDNEGHPLVYVHTSRNIFDLLGYIEDVAQKTGEGDELKISVFSPEYWPLPFYLKNYQHASFWGSLKDIDSYDASIIISASNQHSDLRRKLKDTYSIRSFVLRPGVAVDVWTNNKLMEKYEPPMSVPDFLVSSKLPAAAAPGLRQEVFAGDKFIGNPVVVSRWRQEISFFLDSDAEKPLAPPYSVRWSGYLKIPTDGIYGFALDSDDGSKLFIDDRVLIDNSGFHSLQRRRRGANLSAGAHKVVVEYIEEGGYADMGWYWTPPGKPEQLVPPALFFN